MIVSGNYMNLQMNFHPFWEKPPLFIWLQALSMKAFGVNEFAARFPNAVCGVLSLVLLFHIGKKQKDSLTGWFWSLSYAASLLPQLYFKSGIIDPWFNLFIFLAFYFFIRFIQEEQKRLVLILQASVLAGMAVLTKGPAALIILGLCLIVLYALNRFRAIISFKNMSILFLTVLVTSGIWFLILLAKGQSDIIENFVSYQYHLFHAEDSGHGGPFYYHFVVLLIGCFPASILALPMLFKKTEGHSMDRGMLVLFWVVLILFSIVQTKIVHYSSLCYYPLTYFAALQLRQFFAEERAVPKWQSGLLLFFAALLALIYTAFPVIAKYKKEIISSQIINDQMVLENLNADVQWSAYDYLPGALMFVSLVMGILLVVQKRWRPFLLLICFANLLSTQFAMLRIVPRVEGYTQKVVIDFYEGLQTKDCYAESLGYLSYAPYFYAQKQPPVMEEKAIRQWMLKGKIDKDAYFVSKITDAESNLQSYPELIELNRTNGFVFYVRTVKP
jgi:4-amino-4-deoxy-L-arabinose transferase-like glycosyltransferase